MEIRDAVEADFDEITAIYNQVLVSSTAIYSDRPATREERLAWWRERLKQNYPVLVAVTEGRILGFGTFGDFRSWPGYRFTVEGTVHIDSGTRGKGVGTALLNELIPRARALGKHSMIAGVDSENTTSLRFLERFGFERAGHLREVGYKFDRFLDLVFLQYWISPPVGHTGRSRSSSDMDQNDTPGSAPESNDSVEIRAATPSDMARLIPMINSAFSVETFLQGPRTDEERLAASMETGTILVATDAQGRLLASVYTEKRGHHGYAGMLAVDPARQGSGLGRRMMEAAEDHFRRLGCDALEITVLSLRPELLPIYRRFGFVETGVEDFVYPHPLAPGLECHCIVMSKPL